MGVIGSRLQGGDVVVREVGRGARARVYLVSDGVARRALKVLAPGDEAGARYEHAVAAAFEHPHVNRVDAVVEVDGRPALLMPFVPGRRLVLPRTSSTGPVGSLPAAERWRRATALRERYLDAFEGLLAGLAYLHGRGVVHRDVKPENVLVDAQGHACLIDFDLAVVAAPGSPGVAPAPPMLVGTIAYLSPEQARGDAALPASDVYAAAVMLYGAMTGEVPFTGAVDDVIAAHRQVDPAPPSSLDPTLAPLDAFLLRALAKDPAERPAHGGDALAALRALRPALRDAAAAASGQGW